MNQKTIIFMGRSGCGKGTQAALIEQLLKKQTPEIPVTHLETGKLFRNFVQGTKFTNELSKKIYQSGGLQPEFLTIHLWSDFFVEEMKQGSHMIIDGTPRRQIEAKVLHTAFEFYDRVKPQVVLIQVSRKWSEERMLERKRADDNKRDIEARLDWYDTEVMPTIAFFRDNAFYDFHEVNGERTIEEIHDDIVKRLGLS